MGILEDIKKLKKLVAQALRTRRPYKVYTALLTQVASANPVATILENSIGNIVWARTGAGVYTATLVGAFIVDKTVVFFNDTFDNVAAPATIVWTSVDVITLTTSAIDNELVNEASMVEIRVYC